MTVSDNTIAAGGLGDFFKNLAKKYFTNQKCGKKCFKDLRRALEIGANVSSAFASRTPKAVLTSLPEVINFYHTAECLY